jgi:hypothetical protein
LSRSGIEAALEIYKFAQPVFILKNWRYQHKKNCFGLKARNVKAWGEAQCATPGNSQHIIFAALNGRHIPL